MCCDLLLGGEDTVRALLVSSLLLLVLLTVYSRWKRENQWTSRLPPGPGLALPVIGHLYLLESNPRQQFLKWGQRLGPMFRLYMGSNLVIVLNGYDVIKEALVTHASKFSNRPHTFISSQLAKNSDFVTAGTGWQIQRRLSVEILRKLSRNNGAVEQKIASEQYALLASIRAQPGTALSPRQLLAKAVSNVAYALAFGQEFRIDDPDTESCLKMMGDQAVLLEGMVVLDFLPFLRYLPGDLFGLKRTLKLRDFIETHLIRRQLSLVCEQSGCESEESEGFMSHYLDEIRSLDKANKGIPEVNEENLVAVVFNILVAAVETTSCALEWTLLYLLHHPEVQQRCFQEIEKNIGLDRSPEFRDWGHLPYLKATIQESLRRASISPFGIHHTVNEDVTLRGYLIPKDTIILACLDSALLSEQVWGDPYNFRPERFLNDAGEAIVREQLIPFSLGPRSCFGERIAKMILVSFLAGIIREFHIRSPPDTPLPTLKDKFGLNCVPMPFDVVFVAR